MSFKISSRSSKRVASPTTSPRRVRSQEQDEEEDSSGKRSYRVQRLSTNSLVRSFAGFVLLVLIWYKSAPNGEYPLQQESSDKRAGHLRFDWTNLPVQSPIAKLMVQHQTNCSLPLGNYNWRKKMFGFGSDLHVWGGALCNGVEEGRRIRTHNANPWVWLDEEECSASDESTMSCYFPSAELQCPDDRQQLQRKEIVNISNPIRHTCNKTKHSPLSIYKKADWRAAGVEMLFSKVSPLVQREAERQLRIVFPPNGIVPKDLITVHMRWGDKKHDNKLINEKEILEAIKRIRTRRGDNLRDPVSILLCTENQNAYAAFRWRAPSNFKIYVDQFYHEMLPHQPEEPDTVYNKIPKMSRALHGKTGLWALGSLLVAMEADAFVLVMSSQWSRLMDELRSNVVNPRCGNCTLVEDAAKGKWIAW